MGMRDHIPGVPKRIIGTTGRASEKDLSKKLGGRLRPASGAMDGAKGDIVLPDFLMEAKSTINDSLSIKHVWLSKIASEASMDNKQPALSVRFTHGDGKPKNYGDWVMIPRTLFEELTERK